MSLTLTTPITGSTVTGLTNPTYTIAEGTANDVNKRLYFVSALGGTQTGVDVHSINKPFMIEITLPKQVKRAPSGVLLATGNIPTPKNEYKIKVVKGLDVNTLGGVSDTYFEIKANVPTGGEIDDVNVAAALSCGSGALVQILSSLFASILAGNG